MIRLFILYGMFCTAKYLYDGIQTSTLYYPTIKSVQHSDPKIEPKTYSDLVG